MKKFGMLLFFLVAVVVAMPEASYAQFSNMKPKEIKKMAKKKAADMEKKGWAAFGSPLPLEVLLNDYYTQMQAEGAQSIVGVASSFKSKNLGKQKAFTSALNDYARQAQTYVRGIAESEMFNDASDPDAEFDRFYAAYESSVAREIKDEVKPVFSIIRSMGDGVYEMETYCVVNEEAASKARQRAVESALIDSGLSEEFGRRLSEAVRRSFDLEFGE